MNRIIRIAIHPLIVLLSVVESFGAIVVNEAMVNEPGEQYYSGVDRVV